VLTRQEERARRALAKEVADQLRRQAKGTGWKVSQGWLFRDDQSWFVEARGSLWVQERKSTLALHLKPMSIDPILWSIVQTPDNIRMPLSFRLFGAWTIATPPRSENEIDEAGFDGGGIAKSILVAASRELEQARQHLSLESFVAFIEERRRKAALRAYLPAIVCAHVLRGDFERALAECVSAREAGEIGGFQIGAQSFVALAIDWLRDNGPARH
jgi:hypothetical protein